MPKPIKANQPDYSVLAAKVSEYTQHIENGATDDDVFPFAIFQLAVEAVYPENTGEAVWEWISGLKEPRMAAKARAQADLAAARELEKLAKFQADLKAQAGKAGLTLTEYIAKLEDLQRKQQKGV